VGRKSDDEAIGAFFDELASQTWLGRPRQFWPRFFFHVTDVQNAASIFACGRLLCRNRARSEQRMATKTASADILGQTSPWLFDFVRLYFRPRTPTFYRNEGIRPIGFRDLDAHCPVPIALLFDAKDVAGRAGVQFSDGNLAGRLAARGEDARFLCGLDFREIYHEGTMPGAEKARLTARRQAEIIVPGELDLEALRFVVTRSTAERQTLLTLLGDMAVAALPQIVVAPSLFHGRWTYVEQASLSRNVVHFLFNPDAQNPMVFHARSTWADPVSGASLQTNERLRALGNVNVPVPGQFHDRPLRLTVHLDDALAFAGVLEPLPTTAMISPR
jgi:hypothetical protein